MEVYECEDAVHAALKQRRPKLIVDIINKVTRYAFDYVATLYILTRVVTGQHLAEEAVQEGDAAAGCTKKKAGIDFVCIECNEDGPEGRARAFFSAPPPTVVFCANRLHSAREVEETMVHELIHAYDYDAMLVQFTVRKMDITKSDLLACSEIRSARESECYQKATLLAALLPDVEFFKKSSLWLHTRCVREHAIRSTKSMFPNEARTEVDKMFTQCYADKSPFA